MESLTDISPCIDAGDNVAADGIATDIDGDPRIADGDGVGEAVVDIGADEFIPAMLDLDIASFTTTKRVSVTGNKITVEISLKVKNMGTFDDPCPATVVGMQNSFEVHRETIPVSDAVGKGPTTFDFQPFEPASEGDILWTVTVDDDDPDVDVAVASTAVSQ